MIRCCRPAKSTQQLKEKQIKFLLEDTENNLQEYKKAVALRDNQIAEANKILQSAKKSYDSVVQENQQLS